MHVNKILEQKDISNNFTNLWELEKLVYNYDSTSIVWACISYFSECHYTCSHIAWVFWKLLASHLEMLNVLIKSLVDSSSVIFKTLNQLGWNVSTRRAFPIWTFIWNAFNAGRLLLYFLMICSQCFYALLVLGFYFSIFFPESWDELLEEHLDGLYGIRKLFFFAHRNCKTQLFMPIFYFLRNICCKGILLHFKYVISILFNELLLRLKGRQILIF